MGCSHSKSATGAAASTTAKAAPSSSSGAAPAKAKPHAAAAPLPADTAKDTTQARASPAASAAPQNPPEKTTAISTIPQHSPSTRTRRHAADHRWKALFQTYKPVDPQDVLSVLDFLISKQIRRLSPVEVTFVQRTVRQLGNSLPTSGKLTMGQRLLSRTGTGTKASQDSTSLDARTIRERHHLLDESIIRKLWMFRNTDTPHPEWQMRVESSNGSAVIDPIGAAYVLMLHMSESLWDRVEAIADESAKQVGLDLDVNHHKRKQEVPLPQFTPPDPIDTPPGVSFANVCFLVSIGLRGSRAQRLQLLFYLMLPPRVLSNFLSKHPAGGVPTWLVEVGSDVVLSLASLAHYYFFGASFLPGETKTTSIPGKAINTSLAIPALGTMETLVNLLYMTHVPVTESPANPSPERKGSLTGNSRISRTSSSNSLIAEWSSAVGPDQSPVMEHMQEIRSGRTIAYADSSLEGSIKHFWEACEPYLKHYEDKWTLDTFSEWADSALDDPALDAIMQRLFAAGNLASPSSEKELVLKQWKEWQQNDIRLWKLEDTPQDPLSHFSHSVRSFFSYMANGELAVEVSPTPIWGGIGGFDGRGGLGYGIAYCIDKQWWDQWVNYVGWDWNGVGNSERRSRIRPGELSTERLLDHSPENIVPGSYGSYEVMKLGLTKNVDYILVPAGVWDVLYELYGGGPPLPRMVLPPPMFEPRERSFSTDSKQMEEEDIVHTDRSVEVVSPRPSKLLRIPEAFSVVTHPWIFHCHVCDPQQPYRRGDAGQMSIRVMATPDQPLWRVFAEIIMRLPVSSVKALNKNGRGQARLWKRVDPSVAKDGMARYGPWNLLCKNRTATLPSSDHASELEENYQELRENWQKYADQATVEGIGLANNDRLMLEHAVVDKNDTFVWPREAAAKAGRERRVAEEDLKFRRLLKGFDEKGVPLKPPPSLVGLKVDAMDVSGRWFPVQITHVQFLEHGDEEETEEEDDEEEHTEEPVNGDSGGSSSNGRKKQVRVDFDETGGHAEWISVESDRIAVSGRFTSSTPDDGTKEEPEAEGKSAAVDAKVKSPTKKSSDVSEQNGKVCTLPGFGACGLNNLGNTCYANSALQCVSYMPLLRAYLLSAQYKATGDLNKDNPLGTGGKLLEEFAELLRVMWSGKYGERSPTRFRGQLGKARSQFSGADQQDAQELLNYLLDALHEDSNKVKKKPYVEALEDDWVKVNTLHTVGEEAWRRFLRRNRSIMADVAMGQVLNTVTCPECGFSSRNFDPFNLLSIPLPPVADVVYQCTVVRRATEINSPEVFHRPAKDGSRRDRYRGRKISDDPQAPSAALILEQYAIATSRLADIGDLRLQLQNLCGIPANQLKLCRLDEVDLKNGASDSSPMRKQMRIMGLSDKEGPAFLQGSKGPAGKNAPPSRIIAFQNTLNPRPLKSTESAENEDTETGTESAHSEDTPPSDEDNDSVLLSGKDQRLVLECLHFYGDNSECGEYDTDMLPIAKAMSRSLWPNNENEFKLGLRVDAIDHRDHWFPGSVVEIIEGVPSEREHEPSEDDKVNPAKTKVRIHFDNFSSKWDETYTIDHFTKGQVRPLYSHATPRPKPTEFLVHHRYHNRKTKTNMLFGQAFHLQCQTEWSTARAGAHILAQAARFLHQPSENTPEGPVDVDEALEVDGRLKRIYEKAQGAVADLIKLLIECDRIYVRAALGIPQGDTPKGDKFRNPDFDATAMSTTLVKKVGALLHRLPFEVRVCTMDSSTGHKMGPASEELPYPFSLLRTIGNFMHGRHGIVLHWRDYPTDKKHSSTTIPVMYMPPPIAVHKASSALVEENDRISAKSKAGSGSGGLQLGECLTEFCKEQELTLHDCWRCPQCKDFREGKQNMTIWRLPDLLTFHIKRFNASSRWREKISTKVNFPLTGLNLTDWCHAESPSMDPEDSCVYDLIGVLNHYGSMTGGHYVASCRATICSPEGSEEVAYSFPGAGTTVLLPSDETAVENGDDRTGWRLGGRKDKENSSQQQRLAAAATAKTLSESAEPLWLQFDDELVEPVPPRNVISETAYVLFYRRRQIHSSNIAKYSTLA